MFYDYFDNKCRNLYYENNIFKFEEVHELRGNHLEGDSRDMFYVNQTDKNGEGHVISRGYETDIAIILSYNADVLTDFH